MKTRVLRRVHRRQVLVQQAVRIVKLMVHMSSDAPAARAHTTLTGLQRADRAFVLTAQAEVWVYTSPAHLFAFLVSTQTSHWACRKTVVVWTGSDLLLELQTTDMGLAEVSLRSVASC
jgi:hypothetical protein